MPWAPLAQGVLAERYPANQSFAADSRAERLKGSIYAERVTPCGVEAGRSLPRSPISSGKAPGQLALAWCKDQPGLHRPDAVRDNAYPAAHLVVDVERRGTIGV